MSSMKVSAFPIEEIHFPKGFAESAHCMTFDQIQQHPLYQRYYEGPTCTAYNPQDGLLYVGLTSYRNDILYSFNPSTKVFRSLGFQAAGERFDVKVHRSLEIDDSGGIFGATACLHDIDQQGEAPGGKIFRYDQKEGKIELLGIPNPPWYIQTITLDRKRQIIYGYTYKRCDLFRFDIKTRSTRLLAFTERDGHNLVIDDQGNLWAFWLQSFGLQGGASPRTTMLKYEPESNRLVWLHNLALPGFSSSDWTYVDMAINGQDGFLYFGMTNGTLLRFDPQSLGFTYLGMPALNHTRIGGMCVGSDGLLYLAVGRDYQTWLYSFDRLNGRFCNLGPIFDSQRNTSCIHTHYLTETSPGLFYVCETDNPERTVFLWECDLRH